MHCEKQLEDLLTFDFYEACNQPVCNELVQACWKYTRKNVQALLQCTVELQTSCYKSVHKLSTSCVRTACS
jgi:Ser/Thr protein kinase RdoA (MazF antagonist)